jgi:hypothetical protein
MTYWKLSIVNEWRWKPGSDKGRSEGHYCWLCFEFDWWK